MIINLLEKKIAEMKELRRLEAIKANKASQDAIDAKYRTLLLQVHQTIAILKLTKDEFNFTLAEANFESLYSLLERLQEVVKSGFASKDLLAEAENSFKNITVNIKKDWGIYFNEITTSTVSTLKIIRALDTELVSHCLSNIETAENWTLNKLTYSNLRKSLDDASILIQKLNLDNEITEFLAKMNLGKASIENLNEKVLSWIRNEN